MAYSRNSAIKAGTRFLRRAYVICKKEDVRDKWIEQAKQVMTGHEDVFDRLHAEIRYKYERA